MNISNVSHGEHNRLPIVIGGLVSLLVYVYLAIQSNEYTPIVFVEYSWVFLLLNGLLLATWYYYSRAALKIPLALVVLFALLFRVVGVFVFPILEDDFYRYLWDGMVLVEHGSPYGVAPSEFFSSELISEPFEDILSGINHPDIATVYGPVLSWIFALCYLVAPGELWPLKIVLVSADMVIIGLLVSLLKVYRLGYTPLILYAWNPLLLKESIITAHPDVLGVMFMILALLFSYQHKYFWAAIAIALAVGSKIFAVLLVPFVLGINWRAWAIFVATCSVVAWPFGIVQAWLPEGLSAMANDWLFNAPLYAILQPWLSFSTAKAILYSVFVLVWLAIYLAAKKSASTLMLAPVRGDLLFGVFLLCVPVLNPWYLVWVLPFIVFYPSVWLVTASISILLFGYASGINLNIEAGLYNHSNTVLVLEYGVIAIAVAADYLLVNRKRNHCRPKLNRNNT